MSDEWCEDGNFPKAGRGLLLPTFEESEELLKQLNKEIRNECPGKYQSFKKTLCSGVSSK